MQTFFPASKSRRRALLFLASIALAATNRADDRIMARPVAPGVEFQTIHRAPGPREVRIIRVLRNEPLISLDAALARGSVRGVERLSGIIQRENRTDAPVVAAVNGDFFRMGGQAWAGCALGPMVQDGELVQTGSGRLCFYITRDRVPHIGPLAPRGRLKLSTAVLPVDRVNVPPAPKKTTLYTARWGWPVAGGVLIRLSRLPIQTVGRWQGTVTKVLAKDESRSIASGELVVTGIPGPQTAALTRGAAVELTMKTPGLELPVQTAVGGGPRLLEDRTIVPRIGSKAPRHPRTAVGFNHEEIVLLTVDGRQPGWSLGVTLHTLAQWMRDLGCTEALNLDGGGSTTAWVRGEIVNRPSDGQQRAVANALLVRSSAPTGAPGRLIVRPSSVVTFPGQAIPLRIWLTDKNFNPVTADLNKLVARVTNGNDKQQIDASIHGGALTLTGGPGLVDVVVRYNGVSGVQAHVTARVVTACAGIVIEPSLVHLCTGEQVRFRAHGVLKDGASVVLPVGRLRWTAPGPGLETLGPGRFKARVAGTDSAVTVRLEDTLGRARVRVAADQVLEGFEHGTPARFSVYPAGQGISGKVEMQDGPAPEGRRFCRMTFDLGAAKRTRAAYIRLDRNLGTALRVSFQARFTGEPAVWLRVALIDGNGSRHTFTAASRLPGDGRWRALSVRLPTGTKPPVSWQSIYVVDTGGKACRGTLDVDDLRVAAVPTPAAGE